MRVEIHCPGTRDAVLRTRSTPRTRTAARRARSQTVKALTGLPINYLITVNFRGFRQIVDRLGGAWIDVDRRYFNDRSGPYGYAKIDLQPGYQRLTGRQALDYVRYRHTDSDLYRVARQQQFVKAFKGQIQESFAPIALPKVVNAITNNVEVAQGGGADVAGRTVLSYALFAYGLPRGRVFQTRIEGLEGFAGAHDRLRRTSRARSQTFTHPDVESSEKATAVALGEKLKRDGAGAARHERHRPERERRLGLGVDRRATSSAARLPDPHSAERPARERAAFDYFRTQVYFDPRAARRSRRPRAQGREPVRVGRDEARCRRRSRSSRTAPCSPSSSARRSTAASRRPRSTRRRDAERPNVVSGPSAVARPAARAPLARALPADGPDGDRAQLLDRRRAMPLRCTGSTRSRSTRPSGSSIAWARTSTGASR